VRIALPEGHPLAARGEVEMAALADEPWVAGHEGTFCHLVVIRSARDAGFEPRVTHVTNDFSVAYALVAACAGVALVPELAGPPPPGVAVRPVAGPPLNRRIYAAVRAGSAARPAIAAMLAALKEAPRG
jgi:DNA-binding transcriptional LysR family regulator